MSIVHTSPHAREQMEPASVPMPLAAIESLRIAATARAADLFDRFRHRRVMHRIARFSDHRLRDLGFERDWDGSIIPRIVGSRKGSG